MVKEFIFYFLLIFGFFCFIETICRCIISGSLPEDIYLVTFFNQTEDREKIVFLAKNYKFKIYAVAPEFCETEEEYYITDRYYNVEFIKNCEEIINYGRKINLNNGNS